MALQDFEKLGAFYLGRSYDLAAKSPGNVPLLYDSKDLVTHAVCVGMTGSGKTGLCLSLIEEAAIDGIPTIAIDPKGDLGNLLLTFPSLRGEDFQSWVNADDAQRKGLSVPDYAKAQAEMWAKGLAAWGQDGQRIQRLRDAADIAIYTPASSAGLPVSILKSFAAPDASVLEDGELLRERISTTATSLLGLLNIAADPIQSREHILLSTLLNAAWSQGRDLDLANLIAQVQTPPVAKVGVMDLETFYPSRDRFALAMALNNLLAAPGFGAWLEGEALDIQNLLYTQQGKPRVAIFLIAHLNDAERMFFVSLLLNQVLGWMRAQTGTTSLRALLYMDEIFGYFPPTANPPSKQPLLTLMKQARAFGLGVVLATQNPVDLDYKGLSNAGTWFIGRLQTERDKARVMDGLEGAAAGGTLDRARLDQILSQLGNRVFLMSNAHDDAPTVFETRWVMSYLRGPLTRAQIKTLMDVRRAGAKTSASAPASAAPVSARTPSARPASRPAVPADIPQVFVPVRGQAAQGASLLYLPQLYGAGRLGFTDARAKIDVADACAALAPIEDAAVPVDWRNAEEVPLQPADLEKSPAAGAAFGELPGPATKAKSYAGWSKDFSDWLFAERRVELFRSPATGEVSKPGETEGAFRARAQHAGRELRDATVEKLRQKYAPKMAVLQDRLRRAEDSINREKQQAQAANVQTAISVGATLLSAFMGRKTVSLSTMGRATTAARGVGRSMKERQDIGRAEENAGAIRQQLADLDAEFQAETASIEAQASGAETLEIIAIKPKKSQIAVQVVALAWVPHWRDANGGLTAAWT
jgi:hypothetical protein